MGSTRLTQSAREVGRVPHGRTARETWVLLRALRCAWGMGQRLSKATRHEITRKYAKEYERASKKDRGRMLDELVAVTGWSRANARRAVAAAARRRGPAGAVQRKPRARTYGYDTLKVLIEVWTLIGEPCGKYLAPISVHTSIRTLRVSYPYVRARGLRWTARAGPLRLAAAATARRALARDQPVTATSSSSIRPLSFFEARSYSFAYFLVIS